MNTLLAIALLCAPPRLRLPLRRVLGPALFITVGLEVLKTLGQFYLEMTTANPAYQVVAGAVGMLVFLKLLNQLILFAATLTATSTSGQITDLARRTSSETTSEPPASAVPSSPAAAVTAVPPSSSPAPATFMEPSPMPAPATSVEPSPKSAPAVTPPDGG